nr:DUF6252 family protein [uncultured Psychroserpens sp.]
MKKLTLLFITILTIWSCGDEVQFSSPAMQGNYNTDLWRATSFSADIDFGGFLIQGSNNLEIVQLITQNDAAGTYELGGDSPNIAIVKDANGVVYSTANSPDPSISIYPTDGQIIIQNVINSTPNLIVGSFWFNAYTEDGLKSVNFNEGVLHRIPIVGGLVAIDGGNACLEANQLVISTRNVFNATDDTMPEFTDICNAYKVALITKIDICGDVDGSIQMIVDSLGDCIP